MAGIDTHSNWSRGCLWVLYGPVVLVLLFLVVNWLASTFPHTVEAETRQSAQWGRWGFVVERPRWYRNGYSLRFWSDTGLRVGVDAPFELVQLRSHRWLSGGRVLVLELSDVYHDSVDFPGQPALLFDFDRNLLTTCGAPWAETSARNSMPRAVPRAEFESLVRHYEPRPPLQ